MSVGGGERILEEDKDAVAKKKWSGFCWKSPSQPATVACKIGSSVETCTRCVHVFPRLAPILNARSVLSNKIFASELSREFIKSALLVG